MTKKWLRVGLISFIILFLELLLIRLISTEIRIFAYLSNLVLLAIFVGSGLGMVVKKKLSLALSAILLLVLVLILKTQYIVRLPNLEFKLFSGITEMLAPLSEAYIWLQVDTVSQLGILIGIGLTVMLLVLLGLTFMPLGQALGQELNQAKKPLTAYSVNIVASLLGMWAFNGLSVLGLSPFLGLVLGQLAVVGLMSDPMKRLYGVVAVVATTVLLLPRVAYQPQQQPVTFWSPYQKLILSLIKNPSRQQAEGWYLEVNNVGYMGLLDLSDYAIQERMAAIEPVFRDRMEELALSNQYDLPYKFKPEAEAGLIIGGGAGNDAAAAVRAKVGQVDVVEIDPKIVALGRKYHAEQPYAKSSVKVTVNDGRAFIETSDKTYDLVVMSLADSHTLSSSLTNVQLDNYLYTLESLKQVKSLLKDEGILFLTFEVTRPWIGQRLQKTITQAFGYAPKIFEVRSQGVFGWGGIVFVAGKQADTVDKIVAGNTNLAKFVNKYAKDYGNETVKVLSDNWPYIYLDKPRLPLLHLIMAAIIIGGLVGFKNRLVPGQKFDWAFFFLGGGFMVYEFQNISKSSLLFGNTWMTNLLIITGVLIFILMANWAVAKKVISFKIGGILLLASLGMQGLVPMSWFNSLSGAAKTVVAVGWLNLPHFFSGIVFAHLFTSSKQKAVACGSNLLGSAVGGFFGIVSFLWGIQSLIYITIGLYGLGLLKKTGSRGFGGTKS